MTDAALAEVERFARRAHRRWRGIAADDFRQEAVVVMLERGREAMGVFDQQEVTRRLTRRTLPVDIPHDVDVERGRRATAADVGRELARATEDTVIQLHLAVRAERLRMAIAEAEDMATRGLPSWVRTCGKTAAAGRYYGMHRELAARFDVTPRQVVSALGRYARVASSSPRVVELRRLLAILEAEAASCG